MRKNIHEGRVAKADQPTLANMIRILVDALKAEGFDAEENYNKSAKTAYIDVAEFEDNIELDLGKGAKYKIIPNMKEIDFDLEGKGMEEFKADAEDLAKELASKLDEDSDDAKDLNEDASEADLSSSASEDSIEGFLVEIVMKGPTGKWDQIGYAGHSDDVDFEEGTIGWDDPEDVYPIDTEENAGKLVGLLAAQARPVQDFMFRVVPTNATGL